MARQLDIKIIVDNTQATRDLAATDTALGKVTGSTAKLSDATKGVEKSLSRMVESFSGRQIIQQALLIEKAIGGVEGVSKLTAAEMKRVNSVVTEATDKFKALGLTAPPGMQKIADATKGANEPMSLLAKTVGVFVGTLSVRAVIGFVSSMLNMASSLQDLHERTDIGVEALQEFGVIAEQSGSSLDAVATAAFQLSRRISEGNTSTVAAIQELGLSFEAIRAMSPEERFFTIGRALGAMTDSATRSEVGMRLMGRSVDELIPFFKHLNDETGSYLTLSAGQVKFLDVVGDAMVRMKRSMIPLIVTMIDGTLGISRMAAAWKSFLGIVAPDKTTEAFKRMTASMSANAQAVKDRAAQVLTGSELDRRAKEAIEELNDAIGAKNKRLAEAKAAADRLTTANASLRSEILRIENVLTGLPMNIGFVDDSVLKLGAQLRELAKDLSAIERHGMSVSGVSRLLAADLEKLGEHVDPAQIHQWAQEWAFVGPTLDMLDKKSRTFGDDLTELSAAFAQLAQVSGDSFGGVAKAIGQGITALNLLITSMDKASTSASRLGQLSAGLGVFSVYAMGITMLSDALTAGSRATSDYIDQWRVLVMTFNERWTDARTRAGQGLVLLEEAALRAGFSLERFHAALNMPMDNQEESIAALFEMEQAINEINDALDRSKRAQELLTEVTSRYQFTIEELGPALQRQRLSEQAQQLYTDWQVLTQAGIDIAAVGREMSASINQFVQDAIKTKTEVDPAMRPMLQSMIDMGLLTDAAGNKITDLESSGITFAMSMSEGFKAIVDSVKELTDTLRRGLGMAIDETTQGINGIPRSVHVRVRYEDPGPPSRRGVFHEGGMVLPFLPRAHQGLAIDEVPIIAQTGEGILNRGAMRRMGGAPALNRMNAGGGSQGGSDGKVLAQLQDELAGLRRDLLFTAPGLNAKALAAQLAKRGAA